MCIENQRTYWENLLAFAFPFCNQILSGFTKLSQKLSGFSRKTNNLTDLFKVYDQLTILMFFGWKVLKDLSLEKRLSCLIGVSEKSILKVASTWERTWILVQFRPVEAQCICFFVKKLQCAASRDWRFRLIFREAPKLPKRRFKWLKFGIFYINREYVDFSEVLRELSSIIVLCCAKVTRCYFFGLKVPIYF